MDGDQEKAVEDFDLAIRLDPGEAWIYAERGESLRLLHRYIEALADFDKSLELDPSDTWTVDKRKLAFDAWNEEW
jgi:tetratricopeptide (TPR) repeat protein